MRLTSSVTKRRADAQDRYRRETQVAVITVVNGDGTYDVRLPSSDTDIEGVVNGSGVKFAVGNTVILQRMGGHRLMVQILATVGGGAPESELYIPDWYNDDWAISFDAATFITKDDESGELSAAIQHVNVAYADRHLPKNHDHSGAGGAGDDTGGPVDHADLANVLADQHHARAHALDAAADHSNVDFSGKADGDLVYWDNAAGKWQPVPRGEVVFEELAAAEETLFQLLEGSLNTSGAPATTWSLLRKNAADNKGCSIVIVGALWIERATRIESDQGGDYFRVYFYTSGGDVILWQDVGHGIQGDNTQDEVWLDDAVHAGARHGFWDQTANASYTLAGLAEGVHFIDLQVDAAAAAGELCCFAEAVVPQYANQDAAVTDDEIEILLPFNRALLYTNGTGRTRGVMASPLAHARAGWLGEGIDHRLPMGTGPTVQTLARSAILEAGKTQNAYTAQMMRWVPFGDYYVTTTFGRSALRPGLNIKAGAAATFGHQYAVPSGDYAFHAVPDQLSASIYVAIAVPALARVTAKGAGSNFDVGELVLFVGTYLNNTAASVDTPWWTYPHVRSAFGLYKLASV